MTYLFAGNTAPRLVSYGVSQSVGLTRPASEPPGVTVHVQVPKLHPGPTESPWVVLGVCVLRPGFQGLWFDNSLLQGRALPQRCPHCKAVQGYREGTTPELSI